VQGVSFGEILLTSERVKSQFEEATSLVVWFQLDDCLFERRPDLEVRTIFKVILWPLIHYIDVVRLMMTVITVAKRRWVPVEINRIKNNGRINDYTEIDKQKSKSKTLSGECYVCLSAFITK
jgi:hypothetical protein